MISSQVYRADYVGNGVTQTFSFAFKITSNSDLIVTVQNLLGVNSIPDYTVDTTGYSEGGTITLSAGPLADQYKLVIRRQIILVQDTDIHNQGGSYLEVIEEAFDRQLMMIQQVDGLAQASVRLPDVVSTSAFNPSLPANITLPDRVLVTNPLGNGFLLGPSTGDVAGAAGSATLAGNAAANAALSEANALVSKNSAASSATSAASSAVSAGTSASNAANAVAAQLLTKADQTALDATNATAAILATTVVGKADDAATTAALALKASITSVTSGDASTLASANTYTDGKVTALVASSPAALDTLNELAAALGSDANFATTTATALGNRVRVDTAAQGLNGTQQANARTNMALGSMATQAASAVAITGGTITSTKLTLFSDTLANLQALARVAGLVYYATDTKKEYVDDGAQLVAVGSGSGGVINYITNPDAENNTTGWAAYNDAITQLQATLGNGTVDEVGDAINLSGSTTLIEGQRVRYTTGGTAIGGLTAGADYFVRNPSFGTMQLALTAGGTVIDLTAEGTVSHTFSPYVPTDGVFGTSASTFTRSTSSPLRGTASFLFTKSAANTQGEGFSYDFTIDAADQARLLTMTVDYAISSGTYADDDVNFFLYDKTNGSLIYPSEGQKLKNHLSTSAVHKLTFQTAYNSTSYRLIAHVSSVSALAYSLKFDNFILGPQSVTTGMPGYDDRPYNPTFSNVGTATSVAVFESRHGNKVAVHGDATWGTVAAGGLRMSLPTGQTVDTSKMPGGASVVGALARKNTSSTDPYFIVFFASDPTGVYVTRQTADPLNATNANSMFTSGEIVSFYFTLPILGWSSNVVMSSEVSGRQIAARAVCSTAASYTSSQPVIIFNGVDFDKTNSFNASTGVFTCPESGVYRVASQFVTLSVAAGGSNFTFGNILYKNGVFIAWLSHDRSSSTTARSYGQSGSVLINCAAGDQLTVRSYADTTTSANGDGTANYASFEKINSGSQTIAATDSISARYTSTSGQSIATGTDVAYLFGTKAWDTRGKYDTSTGEYTATENGEYSVEANLVYAFFSDAGSILYISVFVDNVLYATGPRTLSVASVSLPWGVSLPTTKMKLLAGQKIKVTTYQSKGSSLSMSTVAANNWVQFTRVGNY